MNKFYIVIVVCLLASCNSETEKPKAKDYTPEISRFLTGNKAINILSADSVRIINIDTISVKQETKEALSEIAKINELYKKTIDEYQYSIVPEIQKMGEEKKDSLKKYQELYDCFTLKLKDKDIEKSKRYRFRLMVTGVTFDRTPFKDDNVHIYMDPNEHFYTRDMNFYKCN